MLNLLTEFFIYIEICARRLIFLLTRRRKDWLKIFPGNRFCALKHRIYFQHGTLDCVRSIAPMVRGSTAYIGKRKNKPVGFSSGRRCDPTEPTTYGYERRFHRRRRITNRLAHPEKARRKLCFQLFRDERAVPRIEFLRCDTHTHTRGESIHSFC